MKKAIVNTFVENFGDNPVVILISTITCIAWFAGVAVILPMMF